MVMRAQGQRHIIMFCLLMILYMMGRCMSSVQKRGRLELGTQGAAMTWEDNDGLILLSNNSNFGFGFHTTQNPTLFLLMVIHKSSSTVVWSANSDSPVHGSDHFVFDNTGNAYLLKSGSIIWSTNTSSKEVAAMELMDSGNLVLIGKDSNIIWQSFSYPTDTLLSNQTFSEGMKLVSNPNSNPNSLRYILEIKSGDVILSASFEPPQVYWAMSKDSIRTIQDVGKVNSATIVGGSWNIYDKDQILIWEFVFSHGADPNVTWVAVLGENGVLTFRVLESGHLTASSAIQIPEDQCSGPAACDPYLICDRGSNNICKCPPALPSCKPGDASKLCKSRDPVELVDAGENLSYFALGYILPSAKTDLNGCKNLCLSNCSCVATFFATSSGSCYLFDQIGNLQSSMSNGPSYASFIKISSSVNSKRNGKRGSKRFPIVISSVIVTASVLLGLLCATFICLKKKKKKNDLPEFFTDSSEEDKFLTNLTGMPVRFTFKDLQTATSNFTVKLGQGGFGSVYQGSLPDGTQIAVKRLEGIGQGKKEFRAEVSIIGSIHHHHLVRLKGFCAEGSHRMLVYEYMANGSLDTWLFKKNKVERVLDWETRYHIALGTAKGLAYLHEDCDVKIVHCDIKPENVLLDDHFMAKVSDFGLAKLMTREQSHVFTTLRGTRGYLAPEWLTNYAISEKSDVYSYGMVLLEIIGGRKNYDPTETSSKSHFPSFAVRMMEEGKLRDIIDSRLEIRENDERFNVATKVALWCIQDDMNLRPPMSKVVQMLEGICTVPSPPISNQLGAQLYAGFLKSISEEGSSSGPSNNFYDSSLSAIRLSGPR